MGLNTLRARKMIAARSSTPVDSGSCADATRVHKWGEHRQSQKLGNLGFGVAASQQILISPALRMPLPPPATTTTGSSTEVPFRVGMRQEGTSTVAKCATTQSTLIYPTNGVNGEVTSSWRSACCSHGAEVLPGPPNVVDGRRDDQVTTPTTPAFQGKKRGCDHQRPFSFAAIRSHRWFFPFFLAPLVPGGVPANPRSNSMSRLLIPGSKPPFQ